MNEFEEVLDIFGKMIMAFFALVVGLFFLGTLVSLVSELAFPLGAGFILIFIAMIVATIAEILGKR